MLILLLFIAHKVKVWWWWKPFHKLSILICRITNVTGCSGVTAHTTVLSSAGGPCSALQVVKVQFEHRLHYKLTRTCWLSFSHGNRATLVFGVDSLWEVILTTGLIAGNIFRVQWKGMKWEFLFFGYQELQLVNQPGTRSRSTKCSVCLCTAQCILLWHTVLDSSPHNSNCIYLYSGFLFSWWCVRTVSIGQEIKIKHKIKAAMHLEAHPLWRRVQFLQFTSSLVQAAQLSNLSGGTEELIIIALGC